MGGVVPPTAHCPRRASVPACPASRASGDACPTTVRLASSRGASVRMLSLCCLLLLPALVRADWPSPDKLPASKEPPDPLVLFSGRKVASPEEWSRLRRPELQDLFQHYMYGPIPNNRPEVKAKIEHEDPKALGGKATLREISLTVGPAKAPRI